MRRLGRNRNGFDMTVGSRRQVWNGTAEKTSGGLKRHHLKQKKDGRIVSKKLSNMGKQMLTRLTDAGYAPFRRGEVGQVRLLSGPARRRRR
jgi:hypothetical protein